jgi:hypothetical protein
MVRSTKPPRSSNDSFPIATRIAGALRIVHRLGPALDELNVLLRSNEKAFPQVGRGSKRTKLAVAELYPLAQRGTAIGCGLEILLRVPVPQTRRKHHEAAVRQRRQQSSSHVHPTTRTSSRTAPFPLRAARKPTPRLPLMAVADIAS